MTLVEGTLTVDALRPRTGRGVRVAVIDSGVHASHPHVGGVAGGVSVGPDGQIGDDYVDRLGHGTAVTAAIREKAPACEILVARIFDRRLDASAATLVAALRWAIARQATLINLSLGTANVEHAGALQAVLDEARAAGTRVVAAGEADGVRWLPGSLPGAVAVTLDWGLPRDTVIIGAAPDGGYTATASGYPRPIPGVPPGRNLKGLSFAVANTTGLLAVALERHGTG